MKQTFKRSLALIGALVVVFMCVMPSVYATEAVVSDESHYVYTDGEESVVLDLTNYDDASTYFDDDHYNDDISSTDGLFEKRADLAAKTKKSEDWLG